MNRYTVSFTCLYTTTVEADSFEEAADLAEVECPLDIDGNAYVTNQTTGEEREV